MKKTLLTAAAVVALALPAVAQPVPASTSTTFKIYSGTIVTQTINNGPVSIMTDTCARLGVVVALDEGETASRLTLDAAHAHYGTCQLQLYVVKLVETANQLMTIEVTR